MKSEQSSRLTGWLNNFVGLVGVGLFLLTPTVTMILFCHLILTSVRRVLVQLSKSRTAELK